MEITFGPNKNHWNKSITTLIPLTDPETGCVVAMLGMDSNMEDWQLKVPTVEQSGTLWKFYPRIFSQVVSS